MRKKERAKKMLYKMRESEFEKVYEIIREAFPVDEMRTYDEEKCLLDNPAFEILVWKDGENGAVKGFISVYRIEGFCFVEHFAVNAIYRNEGIGKTVLQELLKKESKVCLEVEPPETEQARRRIEFYRRNGFYLNDYPYIQPPISKGTKPVSLMIMTTGGAIDKAEFYRIKKALYKNVYRV